jgi:hypothetical protein
VALAPRYLYYRKFGTFYEEFLKCFIGDHQIVPPRIKQHDLVELASKLKSQNGLLIKAKEIRTSNRF